MNVGMKIRVEVEIKISLDKTALKTEKKVVSRSVLGLSRGSG